MRIVVCAKITLDTAELGVDAVTGAPRLDGAPYRLSTLDENALEEAVRLRQQQGGGGSIVLLTMTAAAPPELILRALAMGADEAYVVVDSGALTADALTTANRLTAALVRLQPWDLVLCGEGSLDGYNRQVGPRIAEALGIPCLTQVAKVELGERAVSVERALEDRVDTVEASLPALLTVVQEINQPRLPTVLQIMAASRKPLVEWSADGFESALPRGGPNPRAAERIELSAPPSTRRRLDIEGGDATDIARQLASHLREDGAVVRR